MPVERFIQQTRLIEVPQNRKVHKTRCHPLWDWGQRHHHRPSWQGGMAREAPFADSSSRDQGTSSWWTSSATSSPPSWKTLSQSAREWTRNSASESHLMSLSSSSSSSGSWSCPWGQSPCISRTETSRRLPGQKHVTVSQKPNRVETENKKKTTYHDGKREGEC